MRRGGRACTRQIPRDSQPPSPKSKWVPHTLQQAPPLRRHLGGTPADAPASRWSSRKGRLERPEASQEDGAIGEHARSATPRPKWDGGRSEAKCAGALLSPFCCRG